jgi:redox-sensitive bicupin YhaK (pirin superfamily)
MRNNILYKAADRGHANLGWLNSYHTFSFGTYYNPDRVHFGVLRVLNDDTVAPGMGFGTHPHDNMEIVSIPLSGDLEHKDSMGNTTVIRQGDIQVMSAGTGVHHSEYNRNKNMEVKFLQIWIIPDKKDAEPRYDQVSLSIADRKNKLQQVLSPNPGDEGVWINQRAWFFMSNLDAGKELKYSKKEKDNGVFIFVLEGEVTVGSQILGKRDAIGIPEENDLQIKTSSGTELLIMEVPMS